MLRSKQATFAGEGLSGVWQAVQTRVWIGAIALVAAVGGLAVAARLEWPSARLGDPGEALAHVVSPPFSGYSQ